MSLLREGREEAEASNTASRWGCAGFSPIRTSWFRFERDPANVPAGAAYRLTDVEIASRLSFFLWSSIPDEELLAAAEQGKLNDPAVLQRQVRRMLSDPAIAGAGQQLLGTVAVLARAAQPESGRARAIPISTTTCGNPFSARRSCSSTALCTKIAASSI
jgi:hypothetical protein